MTARQLYEGVLIELNKENAPNILLEDFNYFANKAVNNYVNKRYNIYDINQQTTDDLRVLKATAMLKPKKVPDYIGLTMAGDDRMATYEVVMPTDYLHILNCICVYKVNKTYKCYNAGDTWRSPATRLTADMYSQVLDNFWNKPTYKRPYYYIHNVNTSNTIPTNPYGVRNFQIEKNTTINNLQEGFYKLEGSQLIYYYYPKTNKFYGFRDTRNNNYYLGCNEQNKIIEIQNASIPSNVTICSYFTKDYITGQEILPGNSLTWSGPGKVRIVFTDSSFDKFNDNNALFINDNVISFIETLNEVPNITTNIQQSISLDLGTDAKKLSFEDDLQGSSFTKSNNKYGKDAWENDIAQGEGLPRSISVLDENGDYHSVSNIERGQALRYGNVSQVRLEIRYGTDTSVFELTDVYVDYIKAPQNIRLTQKEIDLTEDTSQMLEYPDYVCQEIINELVHLVMENISDQRLQTHPVVTQSIANPAQAQAPQAQGQSAQ